MKTILIVDDEKNIREVYRKLLQREGYKVLSAANAVEAKDFLVKEKVDIVLLDINMAEVDGAELFEIIEAFHKDAKVIVSSVYPLDEQRQRVRNAVDYYDKSRGLKLLLDKVSRHLSAGMKRKRVVLIDDEAKERVLLSHMLERAGYEPVSFSDNEVALKFLERESNRIDLLVLDLKMPKVEGNCFFSLIRKHHPQAKVIVRGVNPLQMQGLFLFDADDYFDKTADYSLFLKKVNSLVPAN